MEIKYACSKVFPLNCGDENFKCKLCEYEKYPFNAHHTAYHP
jgi:hypothetical protein